MEHLQINLSAEDGHPLSAYRIEPGGSPKAVLILGHAMMANARSLDRPAGKGLASYLAGRGYLCYCLDVRGHGGSGRSTSDGNDWSYDDIMFKDLPGAAETIRALHPDKKLAVLGHSLLAHGCLGMLGRYPEFPIDAVVSIAGNIWLPQLDRNCARRAEKTFQLALMFGLSELWGRFPARMIRMGPEDVARAYTRQFWEWWRKDRWTTADGTWDYLGGLARVTRPVLAICSAGDRLMCHPECSDAFTSHLTKAKLCHRIVGRKETGLAYDPDHMQLVVDPRSIPVWAMIADWLDETL
jgi:predicted alpha/beta hydrolase